MKVSSISAQTGVAPASMIASTVATNVKLCVMTSSPGPIPRAAKATRNAAVPDVPTAKELGYDLELDLFRGLSVPKGMPAAIKAKLEDAMIKAANSASFKARAKKLAFTLAPLGSKDFTAKLVKANAQVVKIMKAAGLYRSKAKK